jgi:hypothetical protein
VSFALIVLSDWIKEPMIIGSKDVWWKQIPSQGTVKCDSRIHQAFLLPRAACPEEHGSKYQE